MTSDMRRHRIGMMPAYRCMGLAVDDRRRAWDDALSVHGDRRRATRRWAWDDVIYRCVGDRRHATSVGCCTLSVHGVRRGATGDKRGACCTYRCMGTTTSDRRQAWRYVAPIGAWGQATSDLATKRVMIPCRCMGSGDERHARYVALNVHGTLRWALSDERNVRGLALNAISHVPTPASLEAMLSHKNNVLVKWPKSAPQRWPQASPPLSVACRPSHVARRPSLIAHPPPPRRPQVRPMSHRRPSHVARRMSHVHPYRRPRSMPSARRPSHVARRVSPVACRPSIPSPGRGQPMPVPCRPSHVARRVTRPSHRPSHVARGQSALLKETYI